MATFDLSKLSPEARELLLEASQDWHGLIAVSETYGRTIVWTNKRGFAEEGNPPAMTGPLTGPHRRSDAFWKRVVGELRAAGLIDREGPDLFKVTGRGYEMAALL